MRAVFVFLIFAGLALGQITTIPPAGGGSASFPDQTGNSGKFLRTDGSSVSWESVPGGGDLLAANNLSELTPTAATVRANLGLVIGTNIQAFHANLAALSGLTGAADKGIHFTGAGTMGVFDQSSFARTLMAGANAAAFRSSLGLVIDTDVLSPATAATTYQPLNTRLTNIGSFSFTSTCYLKLTSSTGVDCDNPSAGSGSPGGNENDIQINVAGAFAGRAAGTGLEINATHLLIDTSVVPQKGVANTFTAANTFENDVTANGVNADVDFSGANSTAPIKSGVTPPETCLANTEFFNQTDGTSGSRLGRCNSSGNGWDWLDSGGSDAVTAPSTLSTNAPVLGNNNDRTVKTGTRSGNTTEFATVSGTKTANKQLTFDASGNITASAEDIGGGSGFDPFDFTEVWEREDFISGTPTNGQIGKLGWSSNTSGGGSVAYLDSVAADDRFGRLVLTTGATSGNTYSLHLSGNATVSMLDDPLSFTNWELRWIIRPNSSADICVRCGLIALANSLTTPSNGVYFRYDTTEIDPAWMVVSAASGSDTPLTSGVSVSSSVYYTLRIRSTTLGTVLFSVSSDGGAFSTEVSVCASGCDITTDIPATALTPICNVATRTTGAKSLTFDAFAIRITGLTR